jgi:C4-dicarboxylate transporter DctM subunit
METLEISLIALGAFFALMLLGMPIAFAFALVGGIGTIIVKGLNPGLALLGSAPFTWATNYNLLALPTFIMMGEFIYHAGVSSQLYEAGYKWVGRFRGGLAISTELASTAFGACCGTSLAASATMGTVAFPEMIKYKYNPRLACGSIAAGGSLSSLIPPSAPFIVYGFMTNTSVSKLFIGGIVPGILLSAGFILAIIIMCWRNPSLGPPGPSFPLKERLKSLTGVGGALFIFVVVMGGLFAGVFTPSEAGTIGAFGAFVLIIIMRKLTWSNLKAALKGGIKSTSFVLTITIGAMIFTNFLTVSGFTSMFTGYVLGLDFPPGVLMVFLIIMYVILGCFMDALAMFMLTLPIVFPIVIGIGFDPVWYGIISTMLCEVALITPPVGMNSFIVHGVTGVPLPDVFRGILPFFIMMFLAIIVLYFVPEIVTFLPNIMH